MYILANMWFQTLMRQFFFNIDKIVFGFISTIYDLLISIARTSVLSQADILDMADRIYKLLAIFMVFKVTFSLIMYVVNPDDFSDKSKGVSKLGTNIIISLALLILTPYIFSYAYQLQTIILEDNSMATLIFGNDKNDENEKDKSNSSLINSAGDVMAYTTMQPFFIPNVSFEELAVCVDLKTDDCFTSMKNINPNYSTMVDNYKFGVESENFSMLFKQNLAVAKFTPNNSSEEEFIMDYSYLFSTVTGVVVVLLLLTFCLDVAVRSIKLAFLQLVAPIPIISYIDPKSGKDGLFKKWYQMCFKTFLSLFIRLLALYFAVYIISKIGELRDIIDGSDQTNFFVKIFIIIGALMFAKQLPKILEGLGIKLDGGFQLNPLRKVEKEALGGSLLKKPNDMLGKMGKGIIKAPFSGLSTLGKKTIGGIDAARNGKGFKQGWNRTHGNLHNKFYKKLDEWAPDSAEARKNERTGRENIHRMNEKSRLGEKLYKDAKGDDKNLKFSAEYRASYEAANNAKKEMYAAEANKQAQVAEVEEKLRKGKITQAKAQEEFANINKVAGTATKRYEVAKAKHDEMKKIYAKDAMIEDAYDYFDKTASEEEKRKYKQQLNLTRSSTSSSSNGESRNTSNSSTSSNPNSNPLGDSVSSDSSKSGASNSVVHQESQQSSSTSYFSSSSSGNSGRESSNTVSNNNSTNSGTESSSSTASTTSSNSNTSNYNNSGTTSSSSNTSTQTNSSGGSSNVDSSVQRNISESQNIHYVTPREIENYDENNEILGQINAANAELEEKIKKVNLENRILEINNEIDRLSEIKRKTTNGYVFQDCVSKINQLKKELESLKEQL